MRQLEEEVATHCSGPAYNGLKMLRKLSEEEILHPLGYLLQQIIETINNLQEDESTAELREFSHLLVMALTTNGQADILSKAVVSPFLTQDAQAGLAEAIC